MPHFDHLGISVSRRSGWFPCLLVIKHHHPFLVTNQQKAKKLPNDTSRLHARLPKYSLGFQSLSDFAPYQQDDL